MKLLAGQRFVLEDAEAFIKVDSGQAEAYAVTAGDVSFRQFYLLDVAEGQAAFPAMDGFGEIKVLLYAVEDSEIVSVPFSQVPVSDLQSLMRIWFRKLSDISWIRLLADRGDDMLLSWRNGTVLEGSSSLSELTEAFTDHEQIFSMLLGMRFGSEDKRLNRRMKVRDLSKKMLIENSIRNLLGEESVCYDSSGEEENRLAAETVFIARCVAKALSMPTGNIEIGEDTARQFDTRGLLRRLMQKGNMQMRFVSLPAGWHTKDTGVMIGYYGEDKELAALIPEDPEHYRVITASCPDGMPVTEENVKYIGADAFACYAGFPARKLKLFDLLEFMFRQCWKADYRTVLIVSFVAGLIPLLTPVITETVFQDIIPIFDRQGLATVTQALMVTGFTTAALSVVRAIAVLRISTRVEMTAEAALWGRLMSLPAKFFRRYTVGELASRMGGLGAVKGLVSGEFAGTVFSFIFSFWSIFLMCYYSLKLTVAAVGVWLAYSVFVLFIYRRTMHFQRNLVAAENRTAGTVQQIFAGLSKFRIQGAEEQAYHLWSRDFGEQWNWSLKLRWQNNYAAIVSSIQPFVLTMLLYYIAVYGMKGAGPDGRTVQSSIGYAQFIAFSAAYSAFNDTLGSVIGFIGHFFAIRPQLENLRPILEEVPEYTDEKIDAGTLTGAMEVSHLSFAYEGGEEVLKDISFKIGAGENVAVVGRSGCGKSTLVRLLLGFEQPKQGAVYYDGQDLANLSLPSVRSQLGVVLQNGQLMTGDIFTNIVGTRLLSQDDAWEAAEAAGIAGDIAMMPMGMQTVISEGSANISGGQRQRILIARALVNKPAILIFDEATSALDNRSQAIITDSLEKLKATRIIVAHRLSTIRGCDRILVMDKGRIAENGSFEELVSQGGIFADLVKRQVI